MYHNDILKGTVSGYKGHVLLVSETFEITAKRDVRRAQYGWPHGNYHAHSYRLIEPYAPYDGRYVSTKMKTKYRKAKQTDTSAPLSILVMSFLLVDRAAGQAWASGMIPTSQNHNTRSAYTDVLTFLAQKNVTVSIFIRNMLIQYL